MDENLRMYYEDDLKFLREMGAEFARNYKGVARRLELDANVSSDPHVERLLQGFAFLAARVRLKIDDEYPEITSALLEVIHPHLTRPLPSMSIAQFLPGPDPRSLLSGHQVKPLSRLNSPAVGGLSCQFRTTYPLTLWPLEVESAEFLPDRVTFPRKRANAVSMLQLRLRAPEGVSIGIIPFDRLRFYLDGDPTAVRTLYELLFCNACQVFLQGRYKDGTPEVVEIPLSSVRQVGFGRDESVFPYPDRAFPGYRLLQEYFAFPEKFLFFDVTGLDTLNGREWTESFDLMIFFDSPPRGELTVDRENFRLGCTPIVNLYTRTTTPIELNQTQYEYRVVPDVDHPMGREIYSIDSVSRMGSHMEDAVPFEPFYSMSHRGSNETAPAYWYATRRPSSRSEDNGTEVYLTFVDPHFDPKRPAGDRLTVEASCTNRDLPAKLPFGGDLLDFDLVAPGPVNRVRCLRKPTPTLRPSIGRRAQWDLISSLSLNHLSLVGQPEGPETLRALLRLYDLTGSAANAHQVSGITEVSNRRIAAKLGRSACTGVEVTLEFDETHFVGSGVFLLSSVLDRFFGMYASINSFTKLHVKTQQREKALKEWPARSGERILL